mmetsp:Transcript_23788/g.76437  ORF Transcript_23788/g.76437 Transcript_23788/m.76437 type:complete len:289 (+) Transcript_23788:1096-1962(+)
MLRNWRLYSWMRFTCTSNSACSGTLMPVAFSMYAARRTLFHSLTSANLAWNSGSSANSARPLSSSRSVTHASPPSVLVASLASRGLASSTQRRGVTPFVLFWNFPGNILAKSGNSLVCTSSECRAATPLTVCEASTLMWPMRTILGKPSWMMDMRDSLSMSPGYLASTRCRWRQLMSKMICMWRGSRWCIMSTGHFSSASGSSVWLVYAKVRCVMAHASSKLMSSPSMSNRISSGTPMDGCVSFSWMAFFSGKLLQSRVRRFLNRRTMSCSVADTKKYCCFRRSSRPL